MKMNIKQNTNKITATIIGKDFEGRKQNIFFLFLSPHSSLIFVFGIQDSKEMQKSTPA